MIKVESTWETHSHHKRFPCACGGEFEFELARIIAFSKKVKQECVTSRCTTCGKRRISDFDISDALSTANSFHGFWARSWRPPAGGPYPMAENKFPHLSGSELKTFSLMGAWQILGSAQGSMSTVYLCQHVSDPLRLAVAKLPSTRASRESHLRECELLLLLHMGRTSRHIVQLLDIQARPTGDPMFFIETVLPGPGGCVTLEDWIAKYPDEVATTYASDWFGQIVTGLLHCGILVKGFVHADLKPDNILVAQGWICKIADFGLAGWDGRAARPGAALYRAPELWDGAEPDTRSDVFSLGVLGYQMFSGQSPWPVGTGKLAEDNALKSLQRSAITQPHPSVPEIVLRCLDVDASRRPTLVELNNNFRSPAVRGDLVPSSDLDFSATSKLLIGIGLPQLVVSTLRDFGPSRSVPTRVNLAIALSQTGSLAEAENQYAALAADGVDVRENRAVNLQRLGKHHESLRMLLPVLREQPSSIGVRINASAAANDLKKHALALKLLEPAKKLDPGNSTVLYQLVITLAYLERWSAAKTTLDRFVSVGGSREVAFALREALKSKAPKIFG